MQTDSNEDDYAHHDFEVEYVDPNELKIDSVNERSRNTGPRTDEGDLEKSIKEKGIENPPQARPAENRDGYKVFAGQRRVLAAQAVGISEIPIIVKNLNDNEALAASVNENNEHLKKDVSRKDRANAIQELSEDWDIDRIADEFGVQNQTVRNWLEPTRDFWEDTLFDPQKEADIDTEYIADDILADIRRLMNDPENAERVAKVIIENQFPKKIVRSAIDETDGPSSFVQELKRQWESVSAGEEYIQPRITLTGEDGRRLKKWAKERGLNQEQATKQLVIEKLDEIYSE